MSTLLKTLRSVAAIAAFGLACPAMAGEATIPVTITLDGVQAGDVPLYVSVQKRSEYMGIKGHGEIVNSTTAGAMMVTVNVDVADDYAVSVWHDLNDDGVFSMTESYQILDGWGNSGPSDLSGRPSFDDVKVSVPFGGANASVTMKYPAK